jgi:hypothetical protein
VAEWSCSGLQSRLRRFDSDPRLQSQNEKRGSIGRFHSVAPSPAVLTIPCTSRLRGSGYALWHERQQAETNAILAARDAVLAATAHLGTSEQRKLLKAIEVADQHDKSARATRLALAKAAKQMSRHATSTPLTPSERRYLPIEEKVHTRPQHGPNSTFNPPPSYRSDCVGALGDPHVKDELARVIRDALDPASHNATAARARTARLAAADADSLFIHFVSRPIEAHLARHWHSRSQELTIFEAVCCG